MRLHSPLGAARLGAAALTLAGALLAACSRDVGNEREKRDLIRIHSPRPGESVTSPLLVKGEARGVWFFEASFPVRLLDADGREIGVVPAQAGADWMTESFVPFETKLEFVAPASGSRGTLILQKDNPSGLPEHADELRIPVRFAKR